MRLCDGCEGGGVAVELAPGSAASRRCRDPERLHPSGCSCHHLPADDDRRMFPTAFYLLTTHNQQLIGFNFNLETSATKLVCVRTSSKGYVPSF